MKIVLTSKGRKVQLPITSDDHCREVFKILFEDGDASPAICFSMMVPKSGYSDLDDQIKRMRQRKGLPPWQD